jgi:hypothetical protein
MPGFLHLQISFPVIYSSTQWLYSPLLVPGLFFSFVIICTQTVRLLGRVISPSQSLNLHTGQHKHRKHAHSYPCIGIEPTIPAFERVHYLNREDTVIGLCVLYSAIVTFPIYKWWKIGVGLRHSKEDVRIAEPDRMLWRREESLPLTDLVSARPFLPTQLLPSVFSC